MRGRCVDSEQDEEPDELTVATLTQDGLQRCECEHHSEEQQRDTSSDSEQRAKDDCRDRVAHGLGPRQLVVEERLEQAEHDNEGCEHSVSVAPPNVSQAFHGSDRTPSQRSCHRRAE